MPSPSAPLAILLIATLVVSAPASAARSEYTPYAEAVAAITAAGADLPEALRGKTGKELSRSWPGWIRRQDKTVRERLERGEEDTLANFILLGTSYTRHPRVTGELVEQLHARADHDQERAARELTMVLSARIRDLILAMAAPRRNERVEFMRRLVIARGHSFATPPSRDRMARYLAETLDRASREFQGYMQEIKRARATGDADYELSVRARLFAARGVSLDTTLFPNLAIEETLRHLLSTGVLRGGDADRLAVIGPGLDFIDKREGYDFYPVQTVQPFALLDSALRLGLAQKKTVRVSSLDISSRVNHHIAGLAAREAGGRGYVIQLPLDRRVRWEPAVLRYWETFGDRVARPAPALDPPASAEEVRVRAIAVRPEFLRRVDAYDLNAVYERLVLPEARRFDLVIATNVFVYYGAFEQRLALLNVERMLRRGGILLSNNQLPIPTGSGMESLGYITVQYSDREADGDHVFIYRRRLD